MMVDLSNINMLWKHWLESHASEHKNDYSRLQKIDVTHSIDAFCCCLSNVVLPMHSDGFTFAFNSDKLIDVTGAA